MLHLHYLQISSDSLFQCVHQCLTKLLTALGASHALVGVGRDFEEKECLAHCAIEASAVVGAVVP